MTDSIAVKWDLEDASGDEVEVSESTKIRISEAIDAFAGEDPGTITDEDLEEYIKETIEGDFGEKFGPLVEADHMTEAVAALRQALEKARTT